MAVPLAVSLHSATSSLVRHIGAELVDSLDFTSADPGGFDTCTLTLARPIFADTADLLPFARLVVWDQRHGGIVWDGRIDAPGRSNQSGALRRIDAVGPVHMAEDISYRRLYVDGRLGQFQRVQEALYPPGIVELQEDDRNAQDDPEMLLKMPRTDNADLDGGDSVVVRHALLADCNQLLARVRAAVTSSHTSVQVSLDLLGVGMGVGGASADAIIDTGTMDGTTQTLSARFGNEFSSSHYGVCLRMRWTGADGTIAGTTWRSRWRDVYVSGRRRNADGSVSTTVAASSTFTIPIWEVVADVVGLWLNGPIDGATAAISQGATFAVDQLVYDSPTTALDVLDDVLLLQPGYTWQGWERIWNGGAWGGHRFVFAAKPTTVDAVLDTSAGFDSPQSASEVFNEVAVRWVDRRGRTRTTTASQSVPMLSGTTRRGELDLGSQLGSASQAASVASLFLAAHAAPVNNGTLTVAGPVYTASRGTIQPWEWRAGGLVQLRDVIPPPGDVGTGLPSTYRVTATRYSTRDNTVELTLDDWGSSVQRQLLRLNRRLARLPQQ